MKAVVAYDSAWMEFISLEEARDIITAMCSTVPVYIESNGKVYELNNLRDVSITVVVRANIREVDKAKE